MLTGQTGMDVIKSCGRMQNKNIDNVIILALLHKTFTNSLSSKRYIQKPCRNDDEAIILGQSRLNRWDPFQATHFLSRQLPLTDQDQQHPQVFKFLLTC